MSPVSTILVVVIGAILLGSVIFVPGIRLVTLKLIAYSIFAIGITIRFYILLPLGLLQTLIYFILGEVLEILASDPERQITKITRSHISKLFLLQLQRYNGLGDQVANLSILIFRYMVTIIIYMMFGITYLWLRSEYKFQNIIFERAMLVLAIGIFVNIISSSLYKFAASADEKPKKEEPVVAVETKISPNQLYKLGQREVVSRNKTNDIMYIYRHVAPTLARMQRNDFSIKPYYLAYRYGKEDFYQYDYGFNVINLMEIINELPVIDKNEGMIDYCIYYQNGKNYYKTDYMSRERLKILAKAIHSICTQK